LARTSPDLARSGGSTSVVPTRLARSPEAVLPVALACVGSVVVSFWLQVVAAARALSGAGSDASTVSVSLTLAVAAGPALAGAVAGWALRRDDFSVRTAVHLASIPGWLTATLAAGAALTGRSAALLPIAVVAGGCVLAGWAGATLGARRGGRA
jgi:hypothetical protein